MIKISGSPIPNLLNQPFAIVAIPANNEAERIGRCLAALATQRDGYGAPLPTGCFEILVFANNCRDATADLARAMAADCPHPISVIVETLLPEHSNAGWARKRAMDLAAARLRDLGRVGGVILTSDADSMVGATWIDATLRAFVGGADAVAGYVDADPVEMMRLGRAFVERGRLEDRYMSAVAEIYALCDPRPHDPWPNHRVSAGASLAVTLGAYEAVGGLPVRDVGEDAALTLALEDRGFTVRHSLDVSVTTSCRFEGRVQFGAAETMRYRHANLDTPCDADLEPALATVRRALLKGRLRRWSAKDRSARWISRLRIAPGTVQSRLDSHDGTAFESFWQAVTEASPVLKLRHGLRPSDLPREIRLATSCITALRRGALPLPEMPG